MSSFQQKLALKGSETSIEHFASVLKDVKDRGGWNTASALIGALQHWQRNGKTSVACGAATRCGKVRPLGLLVLGSAQVHSDLTHLLEEVRRDQPMGLLLARAGVSREAWLLEAIIVAMELYLEEAEATVVTVMSNGLRLAGSGGSQVLRASVLDQQLDRKPLCKEESKCIEEEGTGGSNHDKQQTENRHNGSNGSNESNGSNNGKNGNYKDKEQTEKRHSWRLEMFEDQQNQTLRRSDRLSNSGGWRARLAPPTEADEKGEQKRIQDEKEVKATKRATLLAVRRKSSTSSAASSVPRRTRLNSILNSDSDMSFSELSIGGTRRRKKEKRKKAISKSSSPPMAKKSTKGLRWDIARIDAPIRTSKDRQAGKEEVGRYICTICPDDREMPGFEGVVAKWDRNKHGVDCDEVYPGIVLGNGATVKKKDYLKKIGMTHVLNAAEFRGVNIGEDYFAGTSIKYQGLRVEDTPQTQICRHFMEMAQFIDSALSDNGKVFVNCVFGRSRSTSCVVAYLMLKLDWSALKALTHIREKRPIQVNEGFLQQLSDLDYKLSWARDQADQAGAA